MDPSRVQAPRFRMYAAADGPGLQLNMTPRLASWDRGTHPSQIALQQFLNHVHDVASVPMSQMPNRGSLRLGGPFARGDLDNYLFPILHRLGHDRFVSARAVREPGSFTLTIASAVMRNHPEDWNFAFARTKRSTVLAAWKDEVREQIQSQVARTATGPIDLELCLRLSGRRNWATLWKPAIDSLGPILGEGDRPHHPRDDLIEALGVHRLVDDDLGHDIEIGIWWRERHAALE